MRIPFIFILILLTFVTTFAQRPELAVQTGHAAQVVALAYTKDGKLLASGSVDNTIKLWDPSTGNEIAGTANEASGRWWPPTGLSRR